MARKVIEVGKVYPVDEPVAAIEFNLEDLRWLQSLVPHKDSFQKDIQRGIDELERHEYHESVPYATVEREFNAERDRHLQGLRRDMGE